MPGSSTHGQGRQQRSSNQRRQATAEAASHNLKRCYLCSLNTIDPSNWQDHKTFCQIVFKNKLDALPKLQGYTCPKCKQNDLHLISQFMSPNPFKCSSASLVGIKAINCKESSITNTNGNRFSCYDCGISMCIECIAEILFGSHLEKSKVTERIVHAELVQCYLCSYKYPLPDWDSHRRACKSKMDFKLFSLPKLANFKCPSCKGIKTMTHITRKTYTKSEDDFTCKSQELLNLERRPCEGQVIHNNGKNRFNCYECDVDLCVECLASHMFNDPTKTKQVVKDLVLLPRKKCFLCCDELVLKLYAGHKQLCKRFNSERLDRFAQLRGSKCPKCKREPLRLVPAQFTPPEKFECHAKKYFGNTSVDCKRIDRNIGQHRFSCFDCDVNFCIGCIAKKTYGGTGRDTKKVLQNIEYGTSPPKKSGR